MLTLALLLGSGGPSLAAVDGAAPGGPREVDCAGGDVVVRGNGDHVRIRGSCRTLDVSGTGNDVEADLGTGGRIRVRGEHNRVVLHPASADDTPEIVSTGDGNDLSLAPSVATDTGVTDAAPGQPALPAPSAVGPSLGALVLEVDGASQMVACAGRDVLIHGSDGRFRLAGGCRSVSVQGSRVQVEAELAPGARVNVGGSGVRLNYIMAAPGPAPSLSVTGRDSQARHVDHLSPILGAAGR